LSSRKKKRKKGPQNPNNPKTHEKERTTAIKEPWSSINVERETEWREKWQSEESLSKRKGGTIGKVKARHISTRERGALGEKLTKIAPVLRQLASGNTKLL